MTSGISSVGSSATYFTPVSSTSSDTTSGSSSGASGSSGSSSSSSSSSASTTIQSQVEQVNSDGSTTTTITYEDGSTQVQTSLPDPTKESSAYRLQKETDGGNSAKTGTQQAAATNGTQAANDKTNGKANPGPTSTSDNLVDWLV